MGNYLAFDVGTSCMKCVLFDESFQKRAIVSSEYRLLTSAPGRAELPAETYFDTFLACVKELGARGENLASIDSITFTTQGETLIPVDAEGNALANAIVWLDERAGKQARALAEQIGADAFYRRTGLPEIGGALPLAKLSRIRETQPELCQTTRYFLLLEDYLLFRTTGKAVSEPSLLSSTGWFDINRNRYDEELLRLCGMDAEKLPEILPCAQVLAPILPSVAQLCGLSEHTVVTTGAMDQAASALGAGNYREGIVTETTGTALVVTAFAPSPDYDHPSRVTIYRHAVDGFLYLPFSNTAGIVLKWWRDTFFPQLVQEAKLRGESSYHLMDSLAARAPAGSEGLVFLPHFCGKSLPEELPDARGALFGLSLHTRKEELVRCVLEGVAYSLRELLETLESRALPISEIRSLGGGSASDLWTGIKASVTGKPLLRSGETESTALGAAMLGAVALGKHASVQDAYAAARITWGKTEPNGADACVYEDAYRRYRALYQALAPLF